MSAALVIAGYAAIVASLSLLWQIYLWRHRRRNHVEVSAQIALMGMTDGSSLQVIAVTATNHSEHPVRVTGAGIDLQDNSGAALHIIDPPPGSTVPGVVQPHDSGQTFVAQGDYEDRGISPYDPVVAWVRLATGELVKSKPATLMQRT